MVEFGIFSSLSSSSSSSSLSSSSSSSSSTPTVCSVAQAANATVTGSIELENIQGSSYSATIQLKLLYQVPSAIEDASALVPLGPNGEKPTDLCAFAQEVPLTLSDSSEKVTDDGYSVSLGDLAASRVRIEATYSVQGSSSSLLLPLPGTCSPLFEVNLTITPAHTAVTCAAIESLQVVHEATLTRICYTGAIDATAIEFSFAPCADDSARASISDSRESACSEDDDDSDGSGSQSGDDAAVLEAYKPKTYTPEQLQAIRFTVVCISGQCPPARCLSLALGP
jgi:hypothetical protein